MFWGFLKFSTLLYINTYKLICLNFNMLHIIGIGYKKEHINFEMMEIIKKCSYVFLEYYTSFYEDDFEVLSDFISKKITICNREDIEVNVEEKILSKSVTEDVAMLVLGDPLIATTHTDLIIRCKESGIDFKIYNNVSVANYIAKTGLQFYKFGKITSIPFFGEKFMPRTPFIVYNENQKIFAHSLFLLDLNPSSDFAYKGKSRFLTAGDALSFLIKIQKIMIENDEISENEITNMLSLNSYVICCSRMGFNDERIVYGTFSQIIELDKNSNFKEPLCIIIPCKMHEIEQKFLEMFYKIN